MGDRRGHGRAAADPVGKYQGEVVAANLLGEPGEAIPDAVYTDPQAAAVARVPLEVLGDVIQPFPTFSEIYVAALKALRSQITAAGQPVPA